MKHENYTPRERVDRELLQRMLREEDASSPLSCPIGEKNVSCKSAPAEKKSGTNMPSVFPSLAMVYAPMQSFDDLYDAEEGLSHGTIFRALDLPFCPPMTERRCRL